MIATNSRQARISSNRSSSNNWEPVPQLESETLATPVKRVLIAEHRDEVFARLAHDLGAAGHVVFRATRAEELPSVYALAEASHAICNSDLPDASGWLTATKLHMCRRDARVWLYKPRKSAHDASWARLSGVERVLYYRGDLWRLTEQVRKHVLRFTKSQQRFAAPYCQQTRRQSRWEKSL